MAQGRGRPVLYGWTEAHACAGHAVAIAGQDGCLQCHIGRTGVPALTVVEWADGGDANQEEPACGAHYQPYGPVELAYVTAMIAETALDCLLEPPARSFSRVFGFAMCSGRLWPNLAPSSQRPFGKGFQLAVSYDSSSGCGPSRAAAGWPRSPRRRSAIRPT